MPHPEGMPDSFGKTDLVAISSDDMPDFLSELADLERGKSPSQLAILCRQLGTLGLRYSDPGTAYKIPNQDGSMKIIGYSRFRRVGFGRMKLEECRLVINEDSFAGAQRILRVADYKMTPAKDVILVRDTELKVFSNSRGLYKPELKLDSGPVVGFSNGNAWLERGILYDDVTVQQRLASEVDEERMGMLLHLFQPSLANYREPLNGRISHSTYDG